MDVQIDFSIDDAAHAFDQIFRFVLTLAFGNDLFNRCAGRDGKSALVDRLIARIEFGDDEMARGTKGGSSELQNGPGIWVRVF